MGWIAFSLMVIGVVFVVTTIVMGEASVLYTFYPPMQASPWFYIGLVFLVLGIWTAAFGCFINVASWRKSNKGKHISLFSYFVVVLFIFLFFLSFVVTYDLFIFLPWYVCCVLIIYDSLHFA